MSQVRLCPSCGAEVPVGSPADQCPKCLLKEGFPQRRLGRTFARLDRSESGCDGLRTAADR